ncbi:MAG: MCP four helix bundle domain-containing protein, partial [Lachnospiraceae bacterium]|nr:MCP four helix bundle domain-containing protein [Lachnospiraceae bacterium]
MKFIKNAKLTTKFLGSVIILLALMVFIGIWGIVNMGKMNATTDFIYQNNFLSTAYINTINNNLTEARLTTLKIAMEEYAGDMEANLARIDQLNESTSANVQLYRENIAPEKTEDQRLFDEFSAKLALFRSSRDTVLALAQEGKYAEATELNNSETIPAAIATQEAVTALVQFNSDDAGAAVEQAGVDYKGSSTVTIIILVVAVVVGLVLGTFMATIITKPLNLVRTVADKIAGGDLTAQLPERYLQQKDEIGAL